MLEHQEGVQWREWSEEAFAEAKAQDKPILLDIGAVWCHWCHVMDSGIPDDPVHTGTYSDIRVQERISAHFIPIKVDNDRRPDVNARYNMGGWPSTVFLTPDGDTLYGETYVPPPRMIGLLDYITDLWENNRDQIIEQAHQTRLQRAEAETKTAAATEIDREAIPVVLEHLKRQYDAVYGGFGTQPKFPHPAALQFLLEQQARTEDTHLRLMADKTLAGMAGGGLYDRYAGGFFRYSTQRDWNVPHYEKMLEDNARLTAVYTQAASVLKDANWLEVVKSAQEWLLRDMCDPETGAFAGSQDADAEEHYYGHPLAVRATLPTPYIDRTIYIGWNALMVTGLIARYQATGDKEIREAAQKTFAFLTNACATWEGSQFTLRHFYADGSAQGATGLLSDAAAFMTAAMDIAETGVGSSLAWANAAADYVLSALLDPATGAFRDSPAQPNSLGELGRPKFDITENADTALALIRLSALQDNGRYRSAAESALKYFADDFRQYGYHAAAYARAIDAAVRPPLHIVIVGNSEHPALWPLRQAAWRLPIPGKAIQWLENGDEHYPPAPDGSPRAYVCVTQTCHLVTDPNDPLWKQLMTAPLF